VVDGDVDEDARGEAHGDGEDPVGHPALRGGVDDDADADADGARDGEREGVGEAGEERAVREHPEQRDAHGDRREDLVQADGPQRLPRVSLRLCRVDQFWQVNALQ